MPRKITPPKSRGGAHIIPPGQGQPPAGNPDIDPAPMHRCQVCRRMRPDCVRQVYPPEPARWTCHTCLQSAGQIHRWS